MKPYIIELLPDNEIYVAVVIWTSVYDNPSSFLEEIEIELKVKGRVLFDFLLYRGKGSDRFLEMSFNGTGFLPCGHKYTELNRSNSVRKRISEILKDNYDEIVEYSILTDPQKKLIKHGVTI